MDVSEIEDPDPLRGTRTRIGGSYLELVVSSSKNLLEMGRAEIIELALKELAEFFPAARDARLVKATVIKEVHATFAPAPLSEEFRATSGQSVAAAVSQRRLDSDGLAFHHGGRGAGGISDGRSSLPELPERRAPIRRSGPEAARADAFVPAVSCRQR